MSKKLIIEFDDKGKIISMKHPENLFEEINKEELIPIVWNILIKGLKVNSIVVKAGEFKYKEEEDEIALYMISLADYEEYDYELYITKNSEFSIRMYDNTIIEASFKTNKGRDELSFVISGGETDYAITLTSSNLKEKVVEELIKTTHVN